MRVDRLRNEGEVRILCLRGGEVHEAILSGDVRLTEHVDPR